MRIGPVIALPVAVFGATLGVYSRTMAATDPPPPALTQQYREPSDIFTVLEAERKAQDLRHAVAAADALVRQLNSFIATLPDSEKIHQIINKERSAARERSDLATKLTTAKQSFVDAATLFDWQFGIDDEVNPFSTPKERFQRLQEQFIQTLSMNVPDPDVVSRFSALFSETSPSLDKVTSDTKKRFDKSAADLQSKFTDAIDTLVGQSLGAQIRANRDLINSDKFAVPSQEKIDAFKSSAKSIFSDYDTALDNLEKTPEYLNGYDVMRNKITQAGANLSAGLRDDLKNATASENNVQRSRQQISSWLFLGLTAAFVVVIALLLLVPIYYKPDVQFLVFRSPLFLQLFTVYVLSSSIVILALGSFLESNNLATLLAGISGYVLGQLGKDGGRPHENGPQIVPKKVVRARAVTAPRRAQRARTASAERQ